MWFSSKTSHRQPWKIGDYMIARLYNFDNKCIEFDGKILTLEIENPNMLAKFIKDIRDGNNDDTEIAFEHRGKLLDKKDIELIIDFHALSLFNKNLVSKIFNKIENDFKTDYYKFIKFNEFANEFKENFIALLDDLDIETTVTDDYELKNALNFIEFKPENFDDSLVDKIMQYINIITETNIYKLLCFVNLKAYLDTKSIESIFKYSLYKKLPIILIEYHHDNIVIENEIKLLIDKDLCDIFI